jgi:hypothetical protein
MSNTSHSFSSAADPATERPVTHEAIAERARELWLEHGCPAHCDEAIWLEAEAELHAIHEKRYRHPHLQLDHRSEA